MKNIGKSALIVAVIGAITFSAYTINIVSTSESKVKGLEMKKINRIRWNQREWCLLFWDVKLMNR